VREQLSGSGSQLMPPEPVRAQFVSQTCDRFVWMLVGQTHAEDVSRQKNTNACLLGEKNGLRGVTVGGWKLKGIYVSYHEPSTQGRGRGAGGRHSSGKTVQRKRISPK
jgi:hypothetical protein